jgi:hypothetical protein
MSDDIPNSLEFFLLSMGFYEKEHANDRHGPVVRPIVKDTRDQVSVGWMPSFPGEQPPF